MWELPAYARDEIGAGYGAPAVAAARREGGKLEAGSW
jgi:hypothetical protein